MFYKNENHLSKINFSNELTFFKFFENFSTFFFGYPFVAFRTIWIWFSFLFLFHLFSPLFSSFYQIVRNGSTNFKIIHCLLFIFCGNSFSVCWSSVWTWRVWRGFL